MGRSGLRFRGTRWVVYFDELLLYRLENPGSGIDTVAELAAQTLLTTLRVAMELDPAIEVAPEIGVVVEK